MFEILRGRKTFTLPWTTKALVVALLAAALVVNMAIFVFALGTRDAGLIAPTLQFFGTLLPIVVVAIILARADSGVSALQRRTENVFSAVIPASLSRIGEEPNGFYVPNHRRLPPASPRSGRVFVNLRRGDCHADILVFTPWNGAWKAMLLRLEINVQRVNFNLCAPRAILPAAIKATGLSQGFRHTLAGAAAASESEAEAVTSSGYHFLDTDLSRTIGNVEFQCLVGSKFVGEEFLWDSAQQLYFAQDLMFMLRAFLTEAPGLFPTYAGERPPSGFESLADALPAAAAAAKT